ncbi:hypothetical protein FRC18_009575 [Serendipita sp. 400]|nr:hypothetical protein FRC18_009575 [Serendipita sp. 400]
MASPKPLPPIPLTGSNESPPLTIDAQTHLGEVIKYSLASRELSAAWLRPLEDALNRFAQWLAQSQCIQNSRTKREHEISPDYAVLLASSSDVTTNPSVSGSIVQDSDAQRQELIPHLHNILQKQEEGSSHLLVCVVAPPAAATAQDLEFQVIPASSGCIFEPSAFNLPFFVDKDGVTRGEGGTIISGLDFKTDQTLHLIGGSFRFRGLSSIEEYRRLVGTLSIGVYTVKSLVLETSVLRDLGISLVFRPLSAEPTSSAGVEASQGASPVSRTKTRASKKEALWSYLTKRSENIFGRVRALSHDNSPRPSLDSLSDEHPKANQAPPTLPFNAEVKRIREAEAALSTSPGVRFPPPALLNELAEKESQTGYSDLTPSQKTGLRSLLGWDVDHRLSGPNAFLRHQCITVLYSEHVPTPVENPGEETTDNQSNVSWAQCIQPQWTTFRYYSRNEDRSLGEMITTKCSEAEENCSIANCKFKRILHQARWVTGRTQIVSKLDVYPESKEGIHVWISCRECLLSTEPQLMGNGAWLFSLGKFLELLSYSPNIIRLSNPPCEHTKLNSSSEQDLARCRLNIVHHFAYNGFMLTFSTSPVHDVYEVRIPRVQITKGRALASQQQGGTIRDTWQKQEQDKLRLEIALWWKGVKQHMNVLEDHLEIGPAINPLRKPLPPSPPAESEEGDPDETPTPKPIPKSLSSEPSDDKSSSLSNSSFDTDTTRNTTPSLTLLSNLRQAFHVTEQSLYATLSQTPANRLNNVRRLFLSTSKAASNRLSAWEKKHAAGVAQHTSYPEPEWWSTGSYVLPDGSIVVKEGEWASMIAFTLSSADYALELMKMYHPQATSSILSQAGSAPHTASIISSTSKTTTESAVSNATSVDSSSGPSLAGFMHAFAASKSPSVILDPDDESQASNWHSPETLRSQISRRDNPKDGSNILSLKDVLRNKAPADSSAVTSKFTSSNGASSSNLGTKTTSSVFGSASLELATQQAHGTVQLPTPDAVDTFEQILRDAEGGDYALIDSLDSNSPNSTIKASTSPRNSESTVPHKQKTDIVTKPEMHLPPVVPPKDFPTPSTSIANTPATEKTLDQAMQSDSTTISGSAYSDLGGITMSTISAVGTLTSSIANAMRFVLAVAQNESERPLPEIPHHGLLAMESPDIDTKPHIRYDCIIGKRLKFSCTVYYAKQFDSLRRRCGIDEVLVESLKWTENWAADGGKSKSNFWKTKDDRFIIKTLVDAWNVADLQVLIELGPSYFRFMDKTSKKPSIMAKMLGFFTVEVKNMETGAVQSKADLLIMENLFYERKISQTFDLKGIEGRKVKPSGKGPQSKTLFDGEWIEGQKKALILLHPHSKIVLEEGISLDTEFLAQSNIMDYSLLLGVDKTRDHLACGLVDTIGSYTFAKTLEYKAKQNIRKQVTVVPPNEYRDRFVKAINSYFVACPDKWSHPGPDFVFSSELPSIF